MLADGQTCREIRALVDATYEAMSTPGSNVAEIFGADDIAIAGSGQGELWSGPDEVVAVATVVSSSGFRWSPEKVTVWRRGQVAWAQILGSVRVMRDGSDELVPYFDHRRLRARGRSLALALLGRIRTTGIGEGLRACEPAWASWFSLGGGGLAPPEP